MATYWHNANLFTKSRIEDELKKFGVKVGGQLVLDALPAIVAHLAGVLQYSSSSRKDVRSV